jgi:hypothetical protein
MDGAVYGIIYSGISAGQGSPSSIFEAVSSQHCIRAVSEHPAVCKAQLGGAGRTILMRDGSTADHASLT